MTTCEICGKPPSRYPNWLLSKGHAYHVGCLAEEYERAVKAIELLADMAFTRGNFGPCANDWENPDLAIVRRIAFPDWSDEVSSKDVTATKTGTGNP